MASGGVFIATAIGVCSKVAATVSTAPTMANSHTDDPMTAASSLSS